MLSSAQHCQACFCPTLVLALAKILASAMRPMPKEGCSCMQVGLCKGMLEHWYEHSQLSFDQGTAIAPNYSFNLNTHAASLEAAAHKESACIICHHCAQSQSCDGMRTGDRHTIAPKAGAACAAL